MRISTKITLIFLTIIVLLIIRTYINYEYQTDIYNEAMQMKNVDAPLEVMAEKDFSYTVLLTEEVHGALLHAQQGEYQDVAEHKVVYNTMVEQRNNLEKDVKIILSTSNIPKDIKDKINEQLNIINENNPKMMNLELNGFKLMEEKNLTEANSILVGGIHKIYKTNLFQAHDDWTNIQHNLTLSVGKDMMNDSIRLNYFTICISVFSLTFLIFALLIIRSFVIEKTILKKKR